MGIFCRCGTTCAVANGVVVALQSVAFVVVVAAAVVALQSVAFVVVVVAATAVVVAAIRMHHNSSLRTQNNLKKLSCTIQIFFLRPI